MEFFKGSYGNGNLEMEFCNRVAMENLKWNSVIGTVGMEIEMEFFKGVAFKNLEWNSLKGGMTMQISKWNSVMGWQRKF